MERKRSLVSTLISLGIVIFVAIVVLLIKRNERSGKKCYLDTVIEEKDYSLEFERWTDKYNSKDAVFCSIS